MLQNINKVNQPVNSPVNRLPNGKQSSPILYDRISNTDLTNIYSSIKKVETQNPYTEFADISLADIINKFDSKIGDEDIFERSQDNISAQKADAKGVLDKLKALIGSTLAETPENTKNTEAKNLKITNPFETENNYDVFIKQLKE